MCALFRTLSNRKRMNEIIKEEVAVFEKAKRAKIDDDAGSEKKLSPGLILLS